MDFTILYKKKYTSIDTFCSESKYDLFISAFNSSERVQSVFEKVTCEKHWIILSDYGYEKHEFPVNGKCFEFKNALSESEVIKSYFEKIDNLKDKRICIDITGFMRPHLIFMVVYLNSIGIKKFDTIFSDPHIYKSKEKTIFSENAVDTVRQVNGCEGQHISDTSNDLLIIGSGYDHKLIASVAEDKDDCKKIQIFGLPSLQPDMYQENLMRAYKAQEEIGGIEFLDNSFFAPANDPFVTANVLKEIIKKEAKRKTYTNIYLCPLSTKAQTLGFALFYVWECLDKPISVIFPFTTKYSRETTRGFSRIWRYSIELP